MKEKYYIDFGKESHLLKNDSELCDIIRLEELDIKDSDIYLEVGCPRGALARLYKDGNSIYQIDGKLTKKERESQGVEKTDENDAKTIRYLANESPELFIKFEPKDEREIESYLLYSQYRKLTKLNTRLKNQHKASIKDLGKSVVSDDWIKSIDKEKKQVIKQIIKLYPEIKEIEKELNIKGFGETYIAELLIAKDPRLFKLQSAYLRYNNYIGGRHESRKYNRFTKSIFYLVASQTLKNKDKFYSEFYNDKKVELKERLPDKTKNGVHMMALNRTATKICKTFWQTCNSLPYQAPIESAVNRV